MATSVRPFSELEKRLLLVEILKASGLPHQVLLRIVHEYSIDPVWNDVPLPPGRTVNQCQAAFREMLDSLKQYQPRQSHDTRYETNAPFPNAPPLLMPDIPGVRNIQPRPAYLPPMAPMALDPMSSPYPPLPGEQPHAKRRRGRPSKAELEAERRAAEARGEHFPTPKPRKKTKDEGSAQGPARISTTVTSVSSGEPSTAEPNTASSAEVILTPISGTRRYVTDSQPQPPDPAGPSNLTPRMMARVPGDISYITNPYTPPSNVEPRMAVSQVLRRHPAAPTSPSPSPRPP